MDNGFSFSEVVRKLANIIRIGKIAEADGARVRVQIGRIKTGWLPIISMAGESLAWIPITIGELVAVFFPYGESAQAFVLRSIHYNNYPAPDKKDIVSVNTNKAMEVKSSESGEISFNHGLKISSGDNLIEISENGIDISSGGNGIQVSANGVIIKSGGAVLSISGDGINLSLGSSTINLSSGSIDLSSGNISTNPPVCKCEGM